MRCGDETEMTTTMTTTANRATTPFRAIRFGPAEVQQKSSKKRVHSSFLVVLLAHHAITAPDVIGMLIPCHLLETALLS